MHYLLFYETAKDYMERRAAYRDEHLRRAWAASDRGELVLGGALVDPPDAAILLFQADSPDIAERFARADPYVTHDLIKRWHVREWKTVTGPQASTPVKPGPG